MNPEELARTIEARLTDEPDLAATLVRNPGTTIEPRHPASTGGVAALDALRTLTGSLDGKLDIHKTIGEGGMGIIHLATQATLGRHVAVKTLKSGGGNVDATLRILREAWVTGGLEHPNVVPVYDVGVDANGAPVIVMKRVEGRSWSDLLRDPSALTKLFVDADVLEANLRIFIAVCNAIHFAHSRGILHRDIKPENVMVGEFGEVYVLDWGIAVSLRPDPSGRLPLASQATEIAGTPCYMSPEMMLGDPTLLSPRTDVYLLGAVLYEVLAGSAPHSGATLQAMIASVMLSEPVFPPGFPAEARAICTRAMARDHEARFASVEELRRGVEDYLRHRGSRKLARDAKQSLSTLLQTLKEPPSDERALAVYNLLGECRFGYRAALSAWSGNEAARRGLDRALLGVIDHELAEGDPGAATTLLREVSEPPPDVVAKVDAAVKAKAEADERLRKLEQDHNPEVGGRTRSFIGGIFGVLWTTTVLVGWLLDYLGHEPTYAATIGFSALFLLIGGVLLLWARDSLTKTLFNRRIAATLGFHLTAQITLGAGAYLAGMSPRQALTLNVFSWCLTQTLLTIWLVKWFAISAVLSALAYVLSSAYPHLLFPLMTLDNVVFTILMVKVWLPQEDIDLVIQRRAEIRAEVRRRAKQVFLDVNRRRTADDET